MYKFYVGVDTSKKTIDVSWTDGPKPSNGTNNRAIRHSKHSSFEEFEICVIRF